MARISLRSLTQVLAPILGAFVPEGRLKESLRAHLWTWLDPPLYALSKRINRLELQEDDLLFVEIDEGTKFWCLPDRQTARRHLYGKMEVFERFPSFLSVLEEQFVERVYEKHHKIKRGDVIVDVGAHVGVFAVRAAKAVGSEGRIVAIEPDPSNLALLHRNLQGNGLRNFFVVHKGVWSRKSRLKFYSSTLTRAHSFYRKWYDIGEDNFIEVEVDTLDNILKNLGITRVDLMKMDVEGAEVEALKGMDKSLKGDLNLTIAAYHTINDEMSQATVTRHLASKDFEVRVEDGIVYASKRGSPC